MKGIFPLKQNSDTTKKKAKTVKVKKMTKAEKAAFDKARVSGFEQYKKSKAKSTTGGRKSIKSSDLTKEQMKNIFPQ